MRHNPNFKPLDIPKWITWGQRRGAFTGDAGRPPGKLKADRGPNGRPFCGWCLEEVPPRRSAWCSDKCVMQFQRIWSWGAVRDYVYQRDEGKCQRCGTDEPGEGHGSRYSAWEVDHIMPVKDGGTDDPTNLRLLCSRCHIEVGYEQRAARKQRKSA